MTRACKAARARPSPDPAPPPAGPIAGRRAQLGLRLRDARRATSRGSPPASPAPARPGKAARSPRSPRSALRRPGRVLGRADAQGGGRCLRGDDAPFGHSALGHSHSVSHEQAALDHHVREEIQLEGRSHVLSARGGGGGGGGGGQRRGAVRASERPRADGRTGGRAARDRQGQVRAASPGGRRSGHLSHSLPRALHQSSPPASAGAAWLPSARCGGRGRSSRGGRSTLNPCGPARSAPAPRSLRTAPPTPGRPPTGAALPRTGARFPRPLGVRSGGTQSPRVTPVPLGVRLAISPWDGLLCWLGAKSLGEVARVTYEDKGAAFSMPLNTEK